MRLPVLLKISGLLGNALQVLVLTVISAWAEPTVSRVHAPYQMLDSRFAAEDFWPNVWIDNDRVLFPGVQVGKACEALTPGCGDRGVRNAMYIWDTRHNVVKL